MSGNSRKSTKKSSQQAPGFIRDEIKVLILLGISILILISNFDLGGFVGHYISYFCFGILGSAAYVFPFLLFISSSFLITNKKNAPLKRKMIAVYVLYCLICLMIQLITMPYSSEYGIGDFYHQSAQIKGHGGIVGGGLTKLLCPMLGTAGTYVVGSILIIICLVLITEKSFLGSVKKGSSHVYKKAKADAAQRKVKAQERKKLRMDQKAAGVTYDTELVKPEPRSSRPAPVEAPRSQSPAPELALTETVFPEVEQPFPFPDFLGERPDPFKAIPEVQKPIIEEEEPLVPEEIKEPVKERKTASRKSRGTREASEPLEIFVKKEESNGEQYQFPPIDLLKKGRIESKGNGNREIRETALKLQTILQDFGVQVKVTDVSCGPTVTRYELQPEHGVKVSKIVSLTDDIKLNLAATDIRIEAPIPGKAAIGIEVPNKENSSVMFRELVESEEFQKHPSSIAFAVGKDIGGQVVVTDIKKMPHLLIAGATGSGKSVCINTLIMSILYKASPEDVKMIMIDPKVVELSVYNGIPHLLIPVVTDAKKASGALNWAVAEMMKRYDQFAEVGVRDLMSYNKKIETIEDIPSEEEKPGKLPQIVIIVDELADLMMVAPGEVEDAICRLAQLARAAGIHLIIATQRPSVNVITGLIKANMPSRIAFSVSSGVDSRTIIDMNGAEKLLGKGDMLFYPQNYQKPARLQGAFVSDGEVGKVVDFLTANNQVTQYNTEIEEKVNSSVRETTSALDSAEGDGRDAYFRDAGKFIIEKDKASIGMLQRVFKIGFNRAARIMDQLADAGVVGPEEGTKPRKILMTMEEFETFVEECV